MFVIVVFVRRVYISVILFGVCQLGFRFSWRRRLVCIVWIKVIWFFRLIHGVIGGGVRLFICLVLVTFMLISGFGGFILVSAILFLFDIVIFLVMHFIIEISYFGMIIFRLIGLA
jgi:hypothetical protein